MAAWAYPVIDPVALRLGPLAVRWYGLAYLACFLFAWWLLTRYNRRWRLGLSPDDEAFVMLTAVFGVILGGRLGYVAFYGAGVYWREPLRILQLWDGGMSFHGGLAGILLAGVFVSRRLRVPYLTLCDIGAIAAPLGFGLGRLANFVNDELWGRVSGVPWAMVFPNGGPLPRHPSQLYEALLEGGVLLAVMLVLSRRDRPRGELTGWILTLYALFRIFVEFFREPDVQIGFLTGGVTMGQLLSLPVLAGGVWLLVRTRKRARQKVYGEESPDAGGVPPGGPPA
jgi:phosphatidylglycerol:prolipoprotein diacylglycerol transferase